MPEADGLTDVKEFCLDIPAKNTPFSSKVLMRWIGECKIDWPAYSTRSRAGP